MTAVEYLFEELLKLESQYYLGTIGRIDFRKKRLELLEQAKEMERVQICESYIYGAAYGIDINNNLSPQNYYEEKYDTK